MNAAVLAQLLAFAAQAAPEVYEALKKVILAFQQQHPALGDAPPADHEASINADIDKQIDALR